MTILIDKKTLLTHFTQEHKLSRSEPEPPDLKPAAVLVPIIDNPNELAVLFTQRTNHLKHHAGQISFPGGQMEASDKNLEETAMREAEEEVGLRREQITIIGSLPRVISSTSFLVTPFVGLISPPIKLQLDTSEVAETFSVPLAFLLNPNNHKKQLYTQNHQNSEVYVIEYQNYKIWGMTAKILVDMSKELVNGER